MVARQREVTNEEEEAAGKGVVANGNGSGRVQSLMAEPFLLRSILGLLAAHGLNPNYSLSLLVLEI